MRSSLLARRNDVVEDDTEVIDAGGNVHVVDWTAPRLEPDWELMIASQSGIVAYER